MCCLFRTTQLVNELYKDYNKIKTIMVQLFVEYFQNIQNQKDCSQVNYKLNSQFDQNITDKYKDSISQMLSKLDKELTKSIMKDTYKQGQINQFSETSSRKKIYEGYNNGSIIKKLFYTIFEKKTICNCGVSNYSYESSIFLYINLDKENKNVLISDKFLNNKKPINIQCHFCGQKINNLNEIKIIIYPRILIVILEGTNYNNFSLKNQREININNKIYQLYCFCETNNFYFKNSKGWYAYTKNGNCKEYKGIEAAKPKILFYKFSSYINDRNYINQNNNISLSENNINKHININNQMNNQVINNNNMNQMKNNNNYNIYNNNIINNNMNINMNNNNNNNFYINAMNNNNNMNNNFNNMNMNNNNHNFNNMNMNNNNFNNNNMNMNNNNMNMNNNFNNYNMNNNNFNNNMNFNMNNFNNNKNNIPLLKSQNIFLTFILNGKQLFIESNQNEIFQVIISKLEKKYNWVKNINKKAYFYNNQIINIQNTLKQLNILDNSIIYIAS